MARIAIVLLLSTVAACAATACMLARVLADDNSLITLQTFHVPPNAVST